MTRCNEILRKQIEQDETYFYNDMLNDKGLLHLVQECEDRKIKLTHYCKNNAISKEECEVLMNTNETLQHAVMLVIAEKYKQLIEQ